MRQGFIDRTVASLTRQFGRTVTLKNEISRSEDHRTGTTSRSFTTTTVKALCQPARRIRDVAHGISFLRANSNFVYGGDFEVEHLEVTVRKAVLPSDFEITLATILVISGRIYLVVDIGRDQSDSEYFWRVIAKRTDEMLLGTVTVEAPVAKFVLRTVSPTVVIG